MIDLERLLAPDCTEGPACRCGEEMHVDRTLAVPGQTQTSIRIYRCLDCGHEMRLTIWGAIDATQVTLEHNAR